MANSPCGANTASLRCLRMFVALRTADRSRVTSLAAQWDNRLDKLRELAASGHLMCPGCEQRLWFRIGLRRRRHFAHRHLTECPLARQSEEVQEVKAQLFKWLETKYDGKVHLDMEIGVPGWDKLVDLVVEAGPKRKFAYWVFDRQQRGREELLGYRRLPGVHVHFIHTQSTRTMHSLAEIALTASHRDFMSQSEYDSCVGLAGHGHLHFLDGEDAKLRIYRGLRCVHPPNLYGWEVLREDVLSAAKISPASGEIVLPEDVTDRARWKQKQKEAKAVRPKLPEEHGPTPVPSASGEVAPEPDEPSVAVEEPAAPLLNLNGPFRCEDCGIETMDWSSAAPSAGTCVCRSCTRARHQRRTCGGG
jgi:hypothetical protein